MNYTDTPLCKRSPVSSLYRPSTPCDFSTPMPDYQNKIPEASAFTAVRGIVIAGRVTYSTTADRCVIYYELTVQTSENQLVNLIVTSNTYSVDCGLLEKGSEIIAFYDSPANESSSTSSTYDAIVIAFFRSNRFIKADFFDCFLVSQDHLLQLEITNNTYVVDRYGQPYCGSLSNQYLVVLYSNATDSQPATTQPNVVILLS